MRRHDVAVIGLGLIGSATLRHLTAAGVPAIGIGVAEPADPASHTGPFASHHDSGRVTRTLDATLEWAILAQRAIAEYPAIEAASGARFHFDVGVVMAERDPGRIEALLANAGALGSMVSTSQRSPDGRIAAGSGFTWLAEPAPAGFIDPRRMLAAQLQVARAGGGTIVDGEVRAVERSGSTWTIRLTDGATVEAERVVVASGSHTDEIAGLPPLPPLMVRCETVVMAEPSPADLERLAGIPAVLCEVDHPDFEDVYMVPPTVYPDGVVRIKMGAGRHRPRRVDSAEERRSWMRGSDHVADLPELRRLLEALVPNLDARGWTTKPCMITDTATGLPYLDIVDDGLVIAVGGNGYAAKSADAIGAIAADLAITGRWADQVLPAARFRVA